MRLRAAIVLGGLIACQFILCWPSLLGQRILLPLDVLRYPRVYLPAPRDLGRPVDFSYSDQVLQLEMFRQYAVAEVRAGRLPLWNPLNYCGSPFLANNQSAVLSPYRLIDYAWDSPAAIAWRQL